MADLDIAPTKVDEGFVDEFTIPEWRVTYPDLDTLWDAEVLDAWDGWLRDRLARSEYIVLGTFHGNSTWAELRNTNIRVSRWEIIRYRVWKRSPTLLS